jgi:predicted DNA-binding transcriptional regulator AlpA
MSDEDMTRLHKRLDEIELATRMGSKPVLNQEEAAIFIGYSQKGLYQLTSRREIPHYKQHGKLYFKKDELVRWMTAKRVATEKEINSKAVTYTVTHNINPKND